MKRWKHITLLVLSFIFCLTIALFVACNDDSSGTEGDYKVTFSLNYDGATQTIQKSVKANEAVAKPEDPVREGYVFLGWYTQSICVEQFSFETPISENLRVYAKWGLTVATVTFDYGYGEPITQSVDVGKTLTKPSDPVRADYSFVGWYSDTNFTTEFNYNTIISENTTIYAKWTQTLATVTFINYEGTQTTQKVAIGTTVTSPSDDPVREDYRFTGWYEDSACTNLFDFNKTISSDTTVYAGWKLMMATITLNGNYEEAENSSVKINVGEKVDALTEPTRIGYNFVGWCLDSNGQYLFDSQQTIDEDMVLFAKWEKATYIVTFDLGQSGITNPTTQVVYGDAIQFIDDPTRSNYNFMGWYSDSACTQVFDSSTIISENTIIYAGWQSASASGEYVFTYQLNYTGGGVYTTQTYKSGRKVNAPTVPERDGYYFMGWSTDAACTTLFNFSSERVKANTTLYAKWYKQYIFEAEYTYLSQKQWQGLSDNSVGLGCIASEDAYQGANGQDIGASNGYWVAKMYYNGAFIEFDVTSDAAVSDAVIILRLSAEYYDMNLSDDEWKVEVNGTALKYGSVNISGAIKETDQDAQGNSISGNVYKRPFTDYVLNVSVALNAGENVIKLVTNNSNNHSGTFDAETPLIDCIYICSNTNLTWTNCYPENVGQNQSNMNKSVASVGADLQSEACKRRDYL